VFNAPINRVVAPDAIPVIDRLAGECIESIYDILVRRRTERPLEQSFLLVQNLTGIVALLATQHADRIMLLVSTSI
jgi:hypothetical protein